jgi:heme-degrading monooxygenase HmoA
MIARVWHGSTRPADADRYVAHLRQNVVPELRGIEGFRGVQLLRRARGDRVDFIVMTMWESVEAIAKFAGADPEVAVVAPEAQAILTSYDRRAVHYDVVLT